MRLAMGLTKGNLNKSRTLSVEYLKDSVWAIATKSEWPCHGRGGIASTPGDFVANGAGWHAGRLIDGECVW